MAVEPRHEGLPREAAAEHLVEGDQRLDVVALKQQLRDVEVGVVVQHVERLGHLGVAERRAAERDRLVEHRQCVAHASVGLLGDEVERLLVVGDALLRGDVLEVLDAVLDADAVEVVNLAARENRRDDFVLLGGGEDENRMGGGLLERLQKGVEGGRREHVDLVDDEDRVAAHLGDDPHLVDERADVLDRVVRGGVELVDVERAPLVEGAARFALVAGLGSVGVEAVDGLGEDAGAGGLAHAARATEEVGMGQLSPFDGVAERGGDMFLPDDRSEGRGAVFACADDEITHDAAKIRNMREESNAAFDFYRQSFGDGRAEAGTEAERMSGDGPAEALRRRAGLPIGKNPCGGYCSPAEFSYLAPPPRGRWMDGCAGRAPARLFNYGLLTFQKKKSYAYDSNDCRGAGGAAVR